METENIKIRIFMADDDFEDMCLFKDALHDAGIAHELTWFKDGKLLLSALENQDTNLPDIIFLDLNMPVMNGLECLKAIRNSETCKDLSVIIYSTSGQHKDIEDTFAAGANGYLVKPNNYAELKQKLWEILIENKLLYKTQNDTEHYVIQK